MITASQGFTKAQPAVIATKPAKMPLQKPATSSFFGDRAWARKMKTSKPATQGARVVFTATRPALYASSLVFMDKVLPGLNPYHPNQRQKVPKTQNGMLF